MGFNDELMTSPPSSPVTRPTPGAISAAPGGSSGSGSWLSIRAIIHHPARLIILQEFSHKPGMQGRNDTP
jgi:hypothetical protein